MEEGEPGVAKTRINEMLARCDAAKAAAPTAAAPTAAAPTAAEFRAEFEFMTGRKWPGTGLGKRPSSEAELEDAPGREERLRLLREADYKKRLVEMYRDQLEKERGQAQQERDQAQNELDLAQKEREQVEKERDLFQKQCLEAQTKCREAHALCIRAQKASNEWRRLCSEAQKERNESLKMVWQMRGRELDDLPEAQLEQLADDLVLAKERVDAMQLRRKAEALVLAKHPDYACPISLGIMRDPVVTDDGQSYERTEIEAWFKKQREAHEPLTSPLRAPLKSAQLVANHSLRRAIEAAVYAEAELCV